MTWEALATTAGASVAAGLTVQFLKVFVNWATVTYRRVAAAAGVVYVVAATALLGGSWPAVALSVVVGLQAGLAAVAAFDSIRSGLSYRAEPDGP